MDGLEARPRYSGWPFVVSGIQVWLIAGGFGDAGLEVIGSHQLRQTLKVREGTDVGGDPARQFLAPGSFGKGVTAEAHGSDEDGRPMGLAGLAVVNGDGGAVAVGLGLFVLLPDQFQSEVFVSFLFPCGQPGSQAGWMHRLGGVGR